MTAAIVLGRAQPLKRLTPALFLHALPGLDRRFTRRVPDSWTGIAPDRCLIAIRCPECSGVRWPQRVHEFNHCPGGCGRVSVTDGRRVMVAWLEPPAGAL